MVEMRVARIRWESQGYSNRSIKGIAVTTKKSVGVTVVRREQQGSGIPRIRVTYCSYQLLRLVFIGFILLRVVFFVSLRFVSCGFVSR